jgi:hypothetical protein
MPDEIRIPVNAKIPKSLHDSILAAVEGGRYKDKTTCITEALEKLLDNTQEETRDNTEVLQEKETEIQNLQNILQAKYAEIQRLQGVIQEAPDQAELIELRAHFEGLQRLLEERERLLEEKNNRINDLTREVETLNGFAHYFKNVEVKQIEAPAAVKEKTWWKFW